MKESIQVKIVLHVNMMKTLMSTILVVLTFATTTQAYIPADMQLRCGIPGVTHLEVISTERNNATIQAFLDEFMPEYEWECHEGLLDPKNAPKDHLVSNIEAFQECLRDPHAKGMCWWLSKKLKLGGDVNDCKFKGCEILVKSVQFLEDGHAIFCLSTYENMGLGDFEQKEEKKLMEVLKKCVKSQLGYIGGNGSPRVSSLAEFMVQMEEHNKNGHWMLRMGKYEGEEMTAGQFVRDVVIEHKERCGELPNDMYMGHTEKGIELLCDGREFHFHFNKKIVSDGGGEYKYFSSSLDADAE